MRRYKHIALPGLLLAVALLVAACGGSGGGSPQGGGGSGGQSSQDTTGGMSGMDMGETTGGGSTGGMQGMDMGGSTSGGSTGGMQGMGSQEMARQMLTDGGGYSDRKFIDNMVPHHRAAIEEGQVAVENADHQELKKLAEGIVSSQRAEIGQMQDIKQQEYGTRKVPTQMSSDQMQMMGMTQDPQSLAKEDPFDRAFMNSMIPHHESAVAMAQVALDESQNPQIREIARNIVDSQQSEIGQMQGWLDEWYPNG